MADKLLDLRKCNFKDADLSKKVLSGALISESDVSGANLREAVLTKASFPCNCSLRRFAVTVGWQLRLKNNPLIILHAPQAYAAKSDFTGTFGKPAQINQQALVSMVSHCFSCPH